MSAESGCLCYFEMLCLSWQALFSVKKREDIFLVFLSGETILCQKNCVQAQCKCELPLLETEHYIYLQV